MLLYESRLILTEELGYDRGWRNVLLDQRFICLWKCGLVNPENAGKMNQDSDWASQSRSPPDKKVPMLSRKQKHSRLVTRLYDKRATVLAVIYELLVALTHENQERYAAAILCHNDILLSVRNVIREN